MVVVETGVAAGWSSFAILESLRKNGQGKLYSSDFPYFRLKDPEQFIGCLVPQSIRENWHLDIRGDDIAIPAICDTVQNIDIFHYDSDKSYSGKLFAIKQIQKKLSLNSIVIFDDIQDNLFFKNLVNYLNCEYQVFEFEGKYVGQLDGFNITNQQNINI
jgi:predicted O-methyltransferase YrrM